MSSRRGHVFIEIYLGIAALGIAAAILVPKCNRVWNEESAHQCALALDAGGEACPLTGAAWLSDEAGARCCPNPWRHGLEKLCAEGPGEPAVSTQHPPPSTVRRVGWTAAGALSGGLLALVMGGAFLIQLVAFVRNPREWWRNRNRPHF